MAGRCLGIVGIILPTVGKVAEKFLFLVLRIRHLGENYHTQFQLQDDTPMRLPSPMKFCLHAARRSLCLYWLGAGLLIHPACASDPPVVLGQLSRIFNGSPIIPAVTTNPAGLPVTLVYRDLSITAPAGEVQVVFNNTSEVLPLSYASSSFAGGISALGNYVRLGGAARKLESCEVILVNWARAAQYPEWAAINPAGYSHPVTITLYSVSPAYVLTFLAELTKTILVPWRPEVLPSGAPYPFNGHASLAKFEFPDGITLPEQVMVMVDYDTQNTGFAPIGLPGPYNQLNVALDGTEASVGADVDADVVLRVAGDTWNYPNTNWDGFNGPMTRLQARNSVTKTPPTGPGTYQVTATAGITGTEGTAQGILTISSPTSPTYTNWQNTHFTEAQRLAGLAVPFLDADGDGLQNLVEFALGTLPNSPNSSPVSLDGNTGRSISFDRPRGLIGVSYSAEESPDLTTWSTVPLEVTAMSESKETLRASASVASPAKMSTFLRIRVTQVGALVP